MRTIFSKGDGHKRRGDAGEPRNLAETIRPGHIGLSEGIARLRSELDRVFDRFFTPHRNDWSGISWPAGQWAPSIEIIDSDAEFVVRAEVPGLNAKDIEVSVSGDMLVLSGEKREEREQKGNSFVRSERRYGAFRRAISLPPDIDPERISARYDQGVLSVHVSKSESIKPRKIEVSSPTKTSP